jgi:RNA polymerase sigma factor for flagellar operon FliA
MTPCCERIGDGVGIAGRRSVYLVKWAAIMNNPRSESPFPRRATPFAGTFLNDEALFLANLPAIDAVVNLVCRRHHLTAAEADDFASEVRLHIIERNYEPLRKFEGRSSLRTYLTVVVQHLFLDYRNRLWGKWRPSAEAKRHGPLAVLLERLVTRDGWTCDQAMESLRINHRIEIDAPLRALAEKLTQRSPARQFVAESEAEGVASRTPASDVNVLRAEHDFFAKRVQTALDRVRQTLTPEERLILKMRFEDSVPVADIARALHLNQKRLYRTIEQLLATLRQGLEGEGLDRGEVTALFTDGVLSEVDPLDAPQRVVGTGPKPLDRVRASWPKS